MLANRNLSRKDAVRLARALGCRVERTGEWIIYPPAGSPVKVLRINGAKKDAGLLVLRWLRRLATHQTQEETR